ncbi:MAG: RNA polymerase sigma factor [Clostridia bacterium]|nr:RNA polymerase sigma factor [Clostridia bacterium]MBR5880297.1 RNA polymerase sigma factor [Clostridia bacterium]
MLVFLLTLADEQYRPQIERLFKRYHNDMLRIAKRAFRSCGRQNPGMDAEDAVQSTFGSIVRYAHAVPFDAPRAELEAYIFAILKNEICKILEEPELTSWPDMENFVDPESAEVFGRRISIREHYSEVIRAICDMDPRYSTVLLLRYGEDMTVEQIAKLMGIPQPTVYSRLRRGKQQLLERFGKEEDA